MSFKKATRTAAKLKIAITGPSGSGKTYSSLLLAKGMSSRIAFIDTENHSASLYADRFDFDELSLSPPFTVQKYIQSIQDAVKAGYEVLVIDSLTHAWAGEGGLLAQKEALDSRGGNSFTNWGTITKAHEQLKAAVLHSNIHIIATMRSKQDYILEQNDKGKSMPKKVGLAPVQREGMEYEYTTVFDIGMDHQFIVSKDRTGLFDGVIEKISEKTGEQFLNWLNSSSPAPLSEISKENAPLVGANGSTQGEIRVEKKTSQIAPNSSAARREIKNHATGEVRHLAPPTDNEEIADFSAGDYVVKFKSQAMQGKPLRDIPIHEISKTIDWINDKAKKPLARSLSEFLEYGQEWMNEKMGPPETSLDAGPPPFLTDDQLPNF